LELNFSEPIVPFTETIVKKRQEEEASPANKEPELIEISTPNKQVTIRLRAVPLSDVVVK